MTLNEYDSPPPSQILAEQWGGLEKEGRCTDFQRLSLCSIMHPILRKQRNRHFSSYLAAFAGWSGTIHINICWPNKGDLGFMTQNHKWASKRTN